MKPRLGSKSIPVSNGAGTDPKQMEAKSFVDRTSEIERARTDAYSRATGGSSEADFIPGHKRMAGMA